jgi:hypothetical protein
MHELGCCTAEKKDQINKESKFVSVHAKKVYGDECLTRSSCRFTRGEIVPRSLLGSHIQSGFFEEYTSPLFRPGIQQECLDIPADFVTSLIT